MCCFGRGIARAMTKEAIGKAKEMGFGAVFLCGNPDIYAKLGFVPTYRYNIYHKADALAEWSMVQELYTGSLDAICGTIDTI